MSQQVTRLRDEPRRPLSRTAAKVTAGGTAAIALLVTTAVTISVQIKSGLGWPADLVVGTLFAGIVAAIFAAIALGITALLKRLTPLRVAVWAGALAGLAAVIPLASGMGLGTVLLALIVAVPLLTAASLLGGAVAYCRTHGLKRPLALIWLTGATAFAALTLFWVVNPGRPASPAPNAYAAPHFAAVPNPDVPGPYSVHSLHYGSGADRRRPEYAAAADIITPTVDATALFPAWKGVGGRLRTWYWGYGPEALPLNARVWYPDGEGPFPLVLITHGNHRMMDYSDPGYAYLGEHLASHGYIAASVDQNFLNGSLYGDFSGDENPVRGWHLLEHLSLWRTWQETPGHLFAGRVDLDRIALIGHSRGGEAAVLAAAFNTLPAFPGDANVPFDFGFGIQAVVAIAPVDGQYRPADRPAPLTGISYLLITGVHDADVSDLSGGRTYERVHITPGSDAIKAAVHIYGANHGQFNTTWGDRDLPLPFHWLLNKRALLTAADQEQITRAYVGAFLATTLDRNDTYAPLLRDSRAGAEWLPDTLYVTSYRDGTYETIASFDEDIDPTTATIADARISGTDLTTWREQEIPVPYADGTHYGAYVAWHEGDTAALAIVLPADPVAPLSPGTEPALILALADGRQPDADAAPLDLTVRLTFADGSNISRPLSEFGTLQPSPRVKRTKLGPLEDALFPEPLLLQQFAVPLSSFLAGATANDIRSIQFVFDVTPAGALYIDDVSIAALPLP